MSNGLFSLGDVQIGAAATQIGTAVTDLDNALAWLLHVRFAPQGVTGTNVKVYVQVSADQGATWYDIACAAFTAAGSKPFNLSALTPVTTPPTLSDGGLTDNTAQDGLIAERARIKVVSTGTWGAGSVVSARLTAR